VRKPKKHKLEGAEDQHYQPRQNNRFSASPRPKIYHRHTPDNLEREATTLGQKDFSENTLRWGDKNDFPLILAKYVQDSPAASSCISTRSNFIKGSAFSDPDMMKLKVNKNGQTLWDLHCLLSDSLALFEGFTINFKFNELNGITNAYNMAIENCRFVKPDDDLATNITTIKYNPYFGTLDYQKKYTKEYALWDPENLEEQISKKGTKFTGQVYYYGKVKPLYRFYPVPDYWSAKKWIYIDGKIQEAHAENLDNGFFQSVILQMVGDPSAKSKNPAYMKRVSNPDGTYRLEPDKTVGEEFDDMMSKSFSGSSKMGTALVLWALKKEEAAGVNPFPSTANADLFIALQDLTTKNITIATKTPGILANISEGVNLGSGGSEIQKAVELMQSNTAPDRNRLEQFYNEILLPNLQIEGQKIKKNAEIKIKNYNPITVDVKLEDKFWNVLNDKEKRDYVRNNFSEIQLQDDEPKTDALGNDLPQEELQLNKILTNLTAQQNFQLMRIIRQFGKGTLNQEQATLLLQSGFGFSDEQIVKFLGLDDAPSKDILTPEPTTQLTVAQ
jgi:hypothetical protein